MDRELAGLVAGTPERFVPELMRGELIEAQHLARYRWAAALVPDKRVLDAGCGLGYGSTLLAAAGARHVVGVDTAAAVLEAARPSVPDDVDLVHADVVDLPYEAGAFDVVVCFEVIEHLPEPDRALDEFRRVLDDGGLLVVSSPNRDAYAAGNPHHVREFRPDELRAVLSERFMHVRLYRQQDWVTSSVLDDARFEAEGVLRGVTFEKVVACEPGDEVYTLALASDRTLPEVPAYATLTHALEVRRWAEIHAEQRRLLAQQERRLAELEALRVDGLEALDRLREVETRLATVEELEATARQHEATARELNEALHREWEEKVAATRTIEAMRRTRVWRLGERYWRLRDRLRRR